MTGAVTVTRSQWRAGAPNRDGRRYAILYSSSAEPHDANTLEFCYRTLVDRFAFDPGDIQVLIGDTSLTDRCGGLSLWSGGDGRSRFRMQVTGGGNKAAFKDALCALKLKIRPEDLLFIHTSGHGFDVSAHDSPEAALMSYFGGPYGAKDFCADLGTLPPHRALIVLMAQCHSGGFNEPVISASQAMQTYIASSVPLGVPANVTPDGCWNAFACNWIAALGESTDGSPVDADTDRDGSITTCEAFAYAARLNAAYPEELRDTPLQASSSPTALQLTLEPSVLALE
jgi:hypothetical protein